MNQLIKRNNSVTFEKDMSKVSTANGVFSEYEAKILIDKYGNRDSKGRLTLESKLKISKIMVGMFDLPIVDVGEGKINTKVKCTHDLMCMADALRCNRKKAFHYHGCNLTTNLGLGISQLCVNHLKRKGFESGILAVVQRPNPRNSYRIVAPDLEWDWMLEPLNHRLDQMSDDSYKAYAEVMNSVLPLSDFRVASPVEKPLRIPKFYSDPYFCAHLNPTLYSRIENKLSICVWISWWL